jgi:hypothetical protein
MKNNQKYALVSFVAGLAVLGLSLGALSFAQAINPLVCSLSATSVGINQAEVLTATGGNGTFSWTGPNLNITNSTGNQFAVSYPTAGTYPITVTSAGMTATCNLVVTGAVSTGSLYCSPSAQNVVIGQTATVSATGGNGAYVWSSPDLSISNPTGSGFSANYASTGLKTLTVTSAGLSATCEVNVLLGSVVIPPATPVTTTPALPNTGGGYGQQ